MEFKPFQKISRLKRGMFITEKIDGTNAQITITADGQIFVGSRNRWITVDDDNYGFARWVKENESEILKLGEGTHYGEWWGQGIQRGYGLKEKRFSLFNVARWEKERPVCCHIVPVIYRGNFTTDECDKAIEFLKVNGSLAAPGFMKPEGIIVFQVAGNYYFKQTIEKDDEPKSKQGE